MRRPEDNLQMHIVHYLRKELPNAIVFSVPNGGARSAAAGWAMKATGLLAGMPDLGITVENGMTYYIEVKTPKGILSNSQMVLRRKMERLNIPCATVRSLQETEEILSEWGLVNG